MNQLNNEDFISLNHLYEEEEEIEYLKATIYYLRKHGFHELASWIAERKKLSE